VTKYNAAEMSNMTDLWLSGVVFQALNTPKLVFGRGSAPDPAGGAYDALPHPIVGWGGGHLLPYPGFPPRRRRLRSRCLRRLGCQAPNTNSWQRL